MASREQLLTSPQMAHFAARGFLRFDELIPEEINRRFLEEADAGSLPVVPAGVPLAEAYPRGSALGDLIRLPEVEGIIESLVGPNPLFDHHFLHPALSSDATAALGIPHVSQHTHQDSTIDPRFEHFDVQLFYFPHEVAEGMGGTRFIPGSHLRRVSESAIARYQNIRGQQRVVCKAGTLLAFHHGLWHGGERNRGPETRRMFKIRLNPTVPQVRLWNSDDLGPEHFEQRPIFFLHERPDPDHIHSILCRREPWFEFDTARVEFINRIRFWRALLGDPSFDADYWLRRVENRPQRSART